MVAATDFWLLHNEHQRVLDGERRALQKPRISTILVIAPILLIVGLYCLGASTRITIHAITLNTWGVDAKGVITNKERYGSGGKGTTYRAFYSFSANDKQVYALQATIDGAKYYALKAGDLIDVKYVDGNPNDARVDAYNPEERESIVSGLLVGIPSFGLAILGFIAAKMRLRRWHRLILGGQLIEGRIVSLEQKTSAANRGANRYLTMKYEFFSPSNRLISRDVKLDYELAYNKIAAGTSLAILYVHDGLFQVL